MATQLEMFGKVVYVANIDAGVAVAFDPTNAPPGYYAFPKANVPHDQGNLCRFCDWRPECQRSSDADDRLCEKYHCSSREVINRDGETIGRPDKTCVVFKRLPVINQ